MPVVCARGHRAEAAGRPWTGPQRKAERDVHKQPGTAGASLVGEQWDPQNYVRRLLVCYY